MKTQVPWILALALTLPPLALAKEPVNRRAPAVVKTLGSRYKLPTSPGLPMNSARDVSDLVRLQQRHFPGAVVTSGFHDWRTTSKYRSQAGLHLGYDIAMPYGCPFAAGWPGRVVAITPWYGEEYGITVVSPDGTSTTYGHVRPGVEIGTLVQPGTILGTIASDHLDVKMRDPSGNYFDFGGSGRIAPAPVWHDSREAIMAGWLLAQNGFELSREDLRNEKNESVRRKILIQGLENKVPALRESQKLMKGYAEQGLVSRLTVEETHQDLQAAEAELKRLRKDHVDSPQRLQQLEKSLKASEQQLKHAEALARQRGISWKQVENFVQATIANDKVLARNVESYKANARKQNAQRLQQIEGELARSSEQLKAFEELFEMGGIARNELEEARLKNRLLQAEFTALQGSTEGPAGR